MRAKREIRYAEKEHQENLTRARQASELGNALAIAFKQNRLLGSADLKKLEKLEKITKKIRSEAGASDDDFELEQKPNDLAEAIDSVAKVSTSLSEKVLKTPRRVVSASIIEESNVLLELIRIVRTRCRNVMLLLISSAFPSRSCHNHATPFAASGTRQTRVGERYGLVVLKSQS